MPRARLLPAAVVFMAAVPLALSAAAPPHQEALAVDRFVDAAAAYVRAYQAELTSVIADERYVQEVRAQTPRVEDAPKQATIDSEVFFMFATGHDWMTIRDVRVVDGRPLDDRPDLRAALAELSAPQVATRFKAYNSRFNVGRVHRNFNEPTLGLLVFDDRHRDRFKFTRARSRRGDAPSTVRLAFREHKSPTLIRNLTGGSVFMTGEAAIDATTGRVDAISVALTVGSVKVALETQYAQNADLGIAVPVRFTEHYEDGRAPRDKRSKNRYEEIACEATYSNFKRFAVNTRIR